MGYTRNVISGFSWHTALKGANTVITIGKVAILARLLQPTDFGLFSLVAIALGLTEALTQTGINITILQSKHSIRYFLNTAWVIAIVRGLLIAVIMVGMGVGMGRFYGEVDLPILVALAAFIPIIKGFINPAIIRMRKNFEFFQDSLYRLSLTLVETIAAIAIAWFFPSVVALIVAMIIGALFEVVISFIFFVEKPAFEYISNRARHIFSNAKGLTVSAALSYLNENADDFLIGKLAGTFNLGLYHNAYALGHRSNYEFAKATHHGTVPVFARIYRDRIRLRRAFWRSFLVTMGLVGLTSLPLLAAPRFIVNLVLGPDWLGVLPMVRWLVAAGLLQSATIVTYGVFLATKQYRAMNLHLVSSVMLMVGLVLLLGSSQGAVGASMGIFLSRLIAIPFVIWGIYKELYVKA